MTSWKLSWLPIPKSSQKAAIRKSAEWTGRVGCSASCPSNFIIVQYYSTYHYSQPRLNGWINKVVFVAQGHAQPLGSLWTSEPSYPESVFSWGSPLPKWPCWISRWVESWVYLSVVSFWAHGAHGTSWHILAPGTSTKESAKRMNSALALRSSGVAMATKVMSCSEPNLGVS